MANIEIDLKLLYEKKVKSTPEMTVSDNLIDFKNIVHEDGFSVRMFGEYPKRLTIKNGINMTVILEGTITTSSDNKSVQLADCKDFTFDMTKGKIIGNGTSVNGAIVSGQLLYVYGQWKNFKLIGGEFDSRGAKGGAAIQTESHSDPSFSHGFAIFDGQVVLNSSAEGFYNLYNQPTKAFLERLEVRNTKVYNTKRDFWQQANVRETLYENNFGSNGALEKNLDHCSGFSLNGKNDKVTLRKNILERVPQMLYSSTASNIEMIENQYTQGDAMPVNQSVYSKSPVKMAYSNINAPKVLIAALSADNTKFTLLGNSNTIVAPKVERYAGTVEYITPPPIVVISEGQIKIVTTTTWEGVKTVRYFLPDGSELVTKP